MYRKGRIDLKKTGIDSTNDALLAVGDEFQQKIDTATDWELYTTFMQSIEKSIEHSRTVVSLIKAAEKNA